MGSGCGWLFYFIYTTKERDVGRGSGVASEPFKKRLKKNNQVLLCDDISRIVEFCLADQKVENGQNWRRWRLIYGIGPTSW